MLVKMYGIPNCGSVKKAKHWLSQNHIEIVFHDYKKAGIDEMHLEKWCKEFGWEKVVNKKGLTWKGLDENIKNQITDEAAAIKLMLTHTSVIKRPIVETPKGNLIGFDEKEFQKLL